MSTTDTSYTYTELDAPTQLAIIDARIRQLETQRLQLALRVQTPAPGDMVTDQDSANLQQLDDSLAELRVLAQGLTPAAAEKP